MNATSISPNSIVEDNSGDSSDSDSHSDEIGEYYQPISANDDADDDPSMNPDDNNDSSVDQSYAPQILANGHDHEMANGMRSLCLSDGENEEEEAEEDRRRAEADLAIRRAFREDESRRNAPLPVENTTRVMEAMRSISFAAPDWAQRLPEEQWIDRVRRIRESPNTAV